MSLVRQISCAAAALAVAAWVCPGPALAQQQGTVEIQLSASKVEAGQAVRATVSVNVAGGADSPQAPTLTVPPDFATQGPSISTSQQISIVNGQMSRTVGFNLTWLVQGTKPGRYPIGPASLIIGGKRYSGQPAMLDIVPQGTLPQQPTPRPRGFPFGSLDPLDPFGSSGFPRFPGFPQMRSDPFEDEDPIDRLPSYPKELARKTADDPVAFLYAEASPKSVVVGQQVALSIYAYGGRGQFNVGYATDPSRPDFLTHNLDDDNYRPRLYQVPVGGQVWLATEVRNLALFPIKAGRLAIGKMTMGFTGRRYAARTSPKGLIRESQPIFIDVQEPPLRDRPPGYRIGDVGRYSLKAKVEPRDVLAGSAIAVVVDLQGTGYLPLTLPTPERPGVEWLEPTITNDIGVQNGHIGGSRKFRYVVRLAKAGIVDLGKLELPYWDPDRNRYAIAKAALGRVNVRPSLSEHEDEATAPGAEEHDSQLNKLLRPRHELGLVPLAEKQLSDRFGFWALLLGLPLLVSLVRALEWVGTRTARKLAGRRTSQAQLARAALRDAEECFAAGNQTSSASAVERCLCSAVEHATRVKIRGVLRDELPSILVRHGISEPVAQRVKGALDTLDTLRFAGDDVGLRQLLDETRSLLDALRQRSPKAGGKS